MKGEYTLNVDTPVKGAMKSVMEMPGSHDAEGIYFSGRIKQISKRKQIYLRQTSDSEIAFSDTFEWRLLMLSGYCTFKSVSENKTQVTAKLSIRTMTIKAWKNSISICILLFLLSIPAAVWFVYLPLIDSGMKGDISREVIITSCLLLFLFIWPIYGSLLLWFNSGKVKIYLKNISDALGVKPEWN